MLKKCLAALVMVGLIGSVAWAAEEFDWAKEQVGKLHYGLSAQAAKQIIPGQPTLGREDVSDMDGKYHQEWKYPAAGITLDMAAEKKGGPQSIARITITSPSKLKTQRGIGIGSSAAAVAATYGPFRKAEDSTPECFAAGDDYGKVSFDLQQGKVSGISIAATGYPYEKEQIGQLHLGLSGKEVKQIIPGQPKCGPEELAPYDGAYHQEWKYPATGIELDMSAEKKGGPLSIERIVITSPCKLKTQRGIGIGSTEAEVTEAYGRFRNAFASEQFNSFIAGSIFGGVMFSFEKGKVSWILIGANAE
jgi:hypothetical protein